MQKGELYDWFGDSCSEVSANDMCFIPSSRGSSSENGLFEMNCAAISGHSLSFSGCSLTIPFSGWKVEVSTPNIANLEEEKK